MSWTHYNDRHYQYWNQNTTRCVPAIYRFRESFWASGQRYNFINYGVEWQYTFGDGKWHVMPEGLETLEDKQAYVYTLYRLEGHDGNS